MNRLGVAKEGLDHGILREQLELARKERDGVRIARVLNMLKDYPPSAQDTATQNQVPPLREFER